MAQVKISIKRQFNITLYLLFTLVILTIYQSGSNFKIGLQWVEASTTPGVLAQIPPGSTVYQRADFQWMFLLPNGIVAGPFPWNTGFQVLTDGSILILDPAHAPVPPLPDDLRDVPCFPSIHGNCP